MYVISVTKRCVLVAQSEWKNAEKIYKYLSDARYKPWVIHPLDDSIYKLYIAVWYLCDRVSAYVCV